MRIDGIVQVCCVLCVVCLYSIPIYQYHRIWTECGNRFQYMYVLERYMCVALYVMDWLLLLWGNRLENSWLDADLFCSKNWIVFLSLFFGKLSFVLCEIDFCFWWYFYTIHIWTLYWANHKDGNYISVKNISKTGYLEEKQKISFIVYLQSLPLAFIVKKPLR